MKSIVKLLLLLGGVSFIGYQIALLMKEISSGNEIRLKEGLEPDLVLDDDSGATSTAWTLSWFHPKYNDSDMYDVVSSSITMRNHSFKRVSKLPPSDTQRTSTDFSVAKDEFGTDLDDMLTISNRQETEFKNPLIELNHNRSLSGLVSIAMKFDHQVNVSIMKHKVRFENGNNRGIAFIKTHKCGSSTLGSILFRYAARHGLRMPRVHHNIQAGYELRSNVTTCDIALQHIQAAKWKFAYECSLGIYKESQLQNFVDTFSVIVILEKFRESLILMKHVLGWDLIDLSYLNINDSHGSTLRRSWDGLPVTPSPKKFKNIDQETVQRIKELTKLLDQPLYQLALNKLNQQIYDFNSSQNISLQYYHNEQNEQNETKEILENKLVTRGRERRGLEEGTHTLQNNVSSSLFEFELSAFDIMQRELTQLCLLEISHQVQLTRADFEETGDWVKYLTYGWKQNTTSIDKQDKLMTNLEVQNPLLCRWYSLTDLEYEKQIGPDGLAEHILFLNH